MSATNFNGPWKAQGSETSTATWVVDAGGKRVCTMKPGVNDWDHCRLIAAAPSMYDALKIALHVLRKCGPEEVGCERFDLTDSKELAPVFAAIRAAEGK